eukprot:5642565-Lingulodinium_polyedra.AAC.1
MVTATAILKRSHRGTTNQPGAPASQDAETRTPGWATPTHLPRDALNLVQLYCNAPLQHAGYH